MLKLFKGICDRWGLDAYHTELLLTENFKNRIAYLTEISLGLESLYGDSPEIERKWLNEPHHRLDGKKPIDLLIGGEVFRVVEVLREERNV